MAKSIYAFCLIFLTIGPLISYGLTATDQVAPIQAGGKCWDDNTTFNYSTSKRTPWSIARVVPAPPGMANPQMWDQYAAVEEQIAGRLPSSPDIGAHAQAALVVWRDVSSEEPDVLITLVRRIDQTETPLQCISGTWIATSTATSGFDDASELLIAGGGHLTANDTGSLDWLTLKLSAVLDDLNRQPGAKNEPNPDGL